MRDGPWSAGHGISWHRAKLQVGELTIEDLQMAAVTAIEDIVTKWFEQFWISMSPQCLPQSFGSIWLTIRELLRFEDFQEGHLGGHLRYLNDFLQFWIFVSLRCLPSSFGWIRIMVWEEMSFEEFQDGRHGSHLECWDETNLAVLHFSPVPHIKFQLSPTYRSGADVFSRFSSLPPWRPAWILERNEFNYSKTPCHPNASHKV